MTRSLFLSVTAILEVVTGLILLVYPEVLLKLLLGDGVSTSDMIMFGRSFGAVLVFFSVGCWLVRNQEGSARQNGFMIACILYDVVAAIVLAYVGLVYSMSGVLLWPAVVAHSVMAGWGAACFSVNTTRLMGSN